MQPVESLEFPIFEKSMAAQWQAIKALFMSSNENIKDATRELIDVSFRHVAQFILNLCSCWHVLLPAKQQSCCNQHILCDTHETTCQVYCCVA